MKKPNAQPSNHVSRLAEALLKAVLRAENAPARDERAAPDPNPKHAPLQGDK